jgi:TRAP-type C4-dicarboxylate transport system substrate-binding protein
VSTSSLRARLAAVALFICLPHGAALAEPVELTIATTHTTNTPWVHVLETFFVPEFGRRLEARTGANDYRFIEVYGGTLSKWKISLETVESGLAEIGWVGALWEPAKLPLQNITYHLPFLTDDLALLVRIFNRIHRELPAAADAWQRHNQIYLGATGIDTYHLLTNFPVRSLDDLRGRKILAPGPSAVWLHGTGAVPVNGALSTYYTQLKTGVADGVLSILSGAHPYRIHEVAPYVTLVGIGAQITGAITVNLDAWDRFSPAARDILVELGEEYSARTATEIVRRSAAARELMATEGAIITRLPAAEKTRWIAGLPDYGREWVERLEARELPAATMLVMLMAGLREAGAAPLRDWDRYD